jgi:fluoride exporter
MLKWSLIAVGGGFGSMLRYAMQGFAKQVFADSVFPVGTVCVNVLGCLLIGLLAGYFSGPQLVREEYRIGLTVGVLGGFTTFSTYGLETFNLANGGEFRLAALNIVLSNVIGLLAVVIGYRLAERFVGV